MASEYHLQYAQKSDADIAARARLKEMQLRQVFVTVGQPPFAKPVAGVAVLGCPDARFVAHQDRIFRALTGKPITMTTFDISLEHLQAASGVVQHDVTLPLPGGPYDIIYSDVLIHFIDPAKQIDVLVNAWNALAQGGIAIHIFAEEDFRPALRTEAIPGVQTVDMVALQLELNQRNIPYLEVPLRLEVAQPGTDDKVAVDELALVFRK